VLTEYAAIFELPSVSGVHSYGGVIRPSCKIPNVFCENVFANVLCFILYARIYDSL